MRISILMGTVGTIQDASGGVKVSKLDKQTFKSEF